MCLLLITAVCLIVGKTVIAQSCSVSNLPPFGDNGGPGDPHLNINQIQVIVPSYTFNCHGRVVRWGACVQPGGGGEDYELELQVLRQLPVDEVDTLCFSLVGMYSQTGKPTNRCIVFNIPEEDHIPVQPGDIVGFYSDRLGRDDGGVQLDTSVTGVTASYRERANIPAPTIDGCMLMAGSNNIGTSTIAAPIITVVVEAAVSTSPAPPLVTSVFPPPPSSAVAPSPTPPADDPTPQTTDPVVVDPVEGSVAPSMADSSSTPPAPGPSATPPSGGGDGTMAIIGIVIGLLLVIIIILAVLLILFALRLRNKSREKFSPQSQNGIVNPNYESAPAKAKAKRKSKKHVPLPSPNVYNVKDSTAGSKQPEDYTYPLSTLSSDPAYTYIPIGSESTVTTGSHPTFESSYMHYEDPSTLSYRTQDPGTLGSAGIYVPTEEQRIAAGNHYEMLETNEYNTLKFFVEDQTYWSPASTTSDLYAQLAAKKYREIPRHQIVLGDKLGSGQFGEVCKSQWRFSGTSLEAAAKTLKMEAPEVEKVRFLQEAAIMGQFSHPNIVQLYGVVTMREPSMIILELMPNGDLRSYLKKLEWEDESEVQHLFLRFAREIAAGMACLSKKSFVHRDLAARNILLDQNLKCKIGDFGMARDLVDDTYYTSKGGQVPIKWTAPEALLYKKYSVSSDVWSYAMVLFEIWSVGRKPFQNLSNSDVIALVNTGHCQPPAPGCPKEIYRLMVDCWNPAHHERPTFVRVSDYLNQPESLLLSWNEEDASSGASSTKKARELGAAISESRHLYLDLQHKYK